MLRTFFEREWLSYLSWLIMIGVNVAIMIAAFAYRYILGQYDQYAHLLVNYRDGFLKRALIGEIVSFFYYPTVPKWLTYGLGTAIWLVALVLFLLAFRRIIGFTERNLPLFALMFCSPAFLKNFIESLGYFDVYGCVAALILLLIPARSFLYVVLAGAMASILILIHHIHLLMYLPTIAMIVVIRYYCAQPLTPLRIIGGAVFVVPVAVTFLLSQFYGSPQMSEADFHALLQSRMTVPGAKIFTNMWYLEFDEEVRRTWREMPKNAPRIPVYFALLAAHWPLIRSFRDNLRLLDRKSVV